MHEDEKGKLSALHIVDCGASDCFTGAVQKLRNIRDCAPKRVDTAGGRRIVAFKQGTLTLNMTDVDGDAVALRITNAYYAPGMKWTLVSLSKLLKDGYQVRFDKNRGCIIRAGQQTIVVPEKTASTP